MPARMSGGGVTPRRLLWLGLALVLALPALASGLTACLATAFLVEFLSDGSLPVLSALTPAPVVEPLPLAGGAAAALYRSCLFAGAPLVLVHGLAPLGQADPRLQQAARLLSRSGFRVAVPTIPGLTSLRLRPEDAEPVVEAIQALARWPEARPVSVVAVSVGAGPAFSAAADPRVADRVGLVLSLGGYASTTELLRYFLTGYYRFGASAGVSAPNLDGARLFLRANLELVENANDRARLSAWFQTSGAPVPSRLSPEGAAVAALLGNRDPARVGPLIDGLTPALRRLLESLSPEWVVGRLKARLILVHGRNDPAVPFTESLRLAAAAGRAGVRTRLVVVGTVEHVEAAERGARVWSRLGDLGRLWAVVFDLLNSRR